MDLYHIKTYDSRIWSNFALSDLLKPRQPGKRLEAEIHPLALIGTGAITATY